MTEKEVCLVCENYSEDTKCNQKDICKLMAVLKENWALKKKVSLKQIFPFFILYFIAASIITTVAVQAGVPVEFFNPIKELSKFFIVLAMAAIGLNTNIVDLIRTGGKPIIMGFSCWVGITGVSLLLQRVMGIW